jgi:hypothetical protein
VTYHWHDILCGTNLDNGIKSQFAGQRDPPFDTVNGTARNASGAQPVKPLTGSSRAQSFNQQWAQGLAIAVALPRVRKSGIVGQLRKIKNLAKLPKLSVVSGSNDQV